MINLKNLELEYTNYNSIKDLYNKYKDEFEKFNEDNKDELKNLLRKYKLIKMNYSNEDKLIETFMEKNPLFARWYELDVNVKRYNNDLEQYFSTTKTFTYCARFIVLKHKDNEGYELIDLNTQDKLDFSKYDEDKQKYIISDLRNHHSFIGYIEEDDLPLLMDVIEEVDQEIIHDDNDTVEQMEQKQWEEITRCHLIEIQFKKRKNSVSVAKRDESEILGVITRTIKQDEEERVREGERFGAVCEESCFEKALKGSRIYLESKGYVKKKK